MDSIRLFDTESNYNSARGGFRYPTVSYIEGNDKVKYQTEEESYGSQYLTFEALEDGTFTLSIPANVNSTYMTSVSYSTDNGNTWNTTTVDNTAQTITTPTVNAGNKVLWKGVGKQLSSSSNGIDYSSYLSSTGNFNVSGNIMSLLYGDDFFGQTIFPSGSSCNFTYLFNGNTKMLSIKNLNLPATTLADSCYMNMFRDCTSLTTALKLPATTLAQSCYWGMFKGCTTLTTAPVLPATTMANDCYQDMFGGCTSLTNAPALPATALAQNCYYCMFQNCTSLTATPELPATTMANGCYDSMFRGCTALTTAPELPATTLASSCYKSMFQGCTALTSAPELPATTMGIYCYQAMFRSCTALTTAPALPATTVKYYCYYLMFNGCTALTTAPVLPATTLAEGCYNSMFNGCSRLNYIKAMFTTTPSTTYTQNWVNGVASTGTFVKNSAAEWDVTGVNGIPTGWTVQTASELSLIHI